MTATRREVLLAIGAAASFALARRAEAAPALPKRAAAKAAKAPVPAAQRAMATELAPGSTYGTCTLVEVGAACEGAIPIRLSDNAGRAFEVEVMRFDPAAPGIARAGSMAVYLRNGGNGSKASEEEHGLAAMAIAAEIARREAAGARAPVLASVRERSRA